MSQRKVAILIAAFCGVLMLGLLSSRLWVRTYRIPTGAMIPTLPIGSHILVRVGNDVERGTITVFRYPLQPTTTFTKRVVAVGGDEVQIRAKRLFVNGAEVSEPYVRHDDEMIYPNQPALPEPYRSRDHFGPYRVPPGHLFMLGDNRDRSSDSRYWGTVPRDLVIGRVIGAYTWTRVWRP